MKFRCNRFALLEDIHKEIAELSKESIHVKFNSVNTNDNPADLVTRAVSRDKFKAHFLCWLHDPSWLASEALQWPSSELGCLSPDSRMLVLNNAVVISPVGFASSAMVELEMLRTVTCFPICI